MTRLVEVPTQFDDRSFDQFAASYAQAVDGERLLFDAHAAEWASPYGLVGLLAAGEAAARKGERPLLTAPANPDVVSYWARAGFFREAADLFEVHGKVPKVKVAVESEVLLPVTPVRAAEDVHAVVSTIQQRASAILSSELGLDPKATMGFAMALSESCQNIVEHAGTGGWVAVQAYNWRRKLARRVVVIAVADAGVGFRHSLEPTQGRRFGERWGDAAALEAALIQGTSRFRDPGRGQGLAGRNPQRHRPHRHRAALGRRCPAEGRVAGVSWIAGTAHHSGTSSRERAGGAVEAVIPHIMVQAVLQQAVAGFYTDLVTRPTGRAVRENIERDLLPGTVAVMDFTGVGCLDYSCADEIVAKLVRDKVKVLLLRGLTDAHREAIEPVLAGAGLAVLCERADGALEGLGASEPAPALLDELVERRLAARIPGGSIRLTAA